MSDLAAARRKPPRTNELELSLFGPGIGESLVIHLGNGEWVVVDSCFDEQRRAVALTYLESLGVDVAAQVKLVLVTHWHDDHIRGMSQVVAATRTAEFACSAALDGQEFLNLVAARKEVSLVGQTSGVEEFGSILDILAGRTSGRYPPGPDHWAASGMCLFAGRGRCIVNVTSLSPSAHTITASKHKLAAFFPVPGATIKKLPTLTPNDLAVVLQITVGDLRLLLGADLERGQDERRGWRSIVHAKSKTGELNHVYKVAHHGSADADLDEIWSELLVGDCHALVTPYARGRSPRPSSTDVERIKSKTPNVYCTAVPSQPPARDKLVDKTMREVTRHRRALCRSPGHIRLRIPIDKPQFDVGVELFNGALRL